MSLPRVAEGAYAVFAHTVKTGLGVDLGRGDPLMSKKLLHLVQRHADIEQNSGDASGEE